MYGTPEERIAVYRQYILHRQQAISAANERARDLAREMHFLTVELRRCSATIETSMRYQNSVGRKIEEIMSRGDQNG